MKKYVLSFQDEFRRWYAGISLSDLTSNHILVREIEEMERELKELIHDVR